MDDEKETREPTMDLRWSIDERGTCLLEQRWVVTKLERAGPSGHLYPVAQAEEWIAVPTVSP